MPRGSRQVRVAAGREPEPSAAVLDSQAIKTSAVRGDARGYDGGEKNSRQETALAR
jgi:putative transposase